MRKWMLPLLLAALLCACALAETDASGVFASAGTAGGEDCPVGIGNPWIETTAEGLRLSAGAEFGVPAGAECVTYRLMKAERLAEMEFTLGGMVFTARSRAAEEPEDISGLYYDWAQEIECCFGGCEGVMRRAFDEGETVDVCLWYDVVAGRAYSLCTSAPDLDGFDLQAVAEQVYAPAPDSD